MKNLLKYALYIILLICVLMCVLYFCIFNNNLSVNSDDWGNFGGYLGSITGLLAFAGVLYSIQQSNKTHTEDSERDTFFKLLDLHTNKMSSVEFNKKNGAEAFKEFADIANKALMMEIMRQYILEKYSDLNEKGLIELFEHSKKEFEVLEFVYKIYFNDDLYISPFNHNTNSAYIRYQNLIQYIKKRKLNMLHIDKYSKIEVAIIPLENYIKECSKETVLNNIQIVADFIYKEYGYILGHYFRNMYYVMDTIDKFSDKKNYEELFRAQLSRYELALGFFNAVSSNSSNRMIYLLQEFGIFKDTYPDDITVLKYLLDKNKSANITNQGKMLAITNEILHCWN